MNSILVLTLVNIPPREWIAEINEIRQTIGRSVAAQIKIPCRFIDVSQVHAEIYVVNDKVVISDLASSAGTIVNGMPLKPRVAFQAVSGDRILLASVELRLTERSSLPSITDFQIQDTGSMEDSFESAPSVILKTAERQVLSTLSRAEQEVTLWLGRGNFSDESIGRLLHRSPNTVRTQIGTILRKLGLHSRNEIVGLLRRIQNS